MKRGRIDIIIDVLKTAMVGVNKTRIVYKEKLNFKLADKYLALLQKNGLMEKKMDKYIITEKGERFLERAQDVVLNIFPSL
ncbi:MAG: winged helix-turn-helix domain-containing protein, partial [Candidatus Methanoperedens sp.]|nr:winged helix-turn-helix domain-containing protein [Candidatus Methanoperedens sp.]